MTIQVDGPDGSSFEFPDGTAHETITGALQKHYGPPQQSFDRSDPRFQNMDVKAAVGGVPILGGLERKAGAALSSLAHPLTGVGSDKPTFGERYAENLTQEEAAKKAFEEEHPLRNAADEMVGGTLALGGAGGASAATARALGMTGRLLPAARNAAISGASIGALDAATRGGDPSEAAAIGAGTGALGVAGGKLLGRGVQAVRDVMHPGAPVPRTIDVNGRPIPVRESVISGSPDTSREEQALLRSGQPAAMQGEDATAAAMRGAHGDFAEGLAPGAPHPESPMAAADTVSGDLVSQEAQRAAAEVQRGTRAAADLAGIRTDLSPAAPAPETPYGAGQQVSEAIQRGAQQARGARTAAYQAQERMPIEFNPANMLRAGDTIRAELNNPRAQGGRVMVSDNVTPMAQQALNVIDQDVAGLRFQNDAARGNRPITAADIEQTRKALVQLRGAANRAARQNGNWEDARAVGRVMDEFDNFVTTTARARGGVISGDPEAYLAGMARARALHANYRQTYSAQGPGDKVGRFIENVIGKYPGQELTPDAIAAKLFGNASEPGGGDTVAIVQRLRGLFGEGSPEWAAVRKAALSHLTEDLGAPLPHAEQADRVLRFLQGSKGRLLAETLFSPSERANLARYANQVRSVADPVPQAGTIEHKIARLSGRLTGEAATGEQILSELGGKQGAQLASELRTRLTPESFAELKRGMFMKISQAPEGMIPWGDQKVGQNIEKFLATDLAREMFTPAERARMDLMGRAHLRLVPIHGTTNPSGTAHMGERLAKGLKSQMLMLLGFSHGGMGGAAVGAALAKGLEWRLDAKAASRASNLFLGPSAPSAPVRAPQRAAALVAPSTASLRDRSDRR
jgi:hypothetical protein